MAHTIDDVRPFVGADHGLATVSVTRPDGSVHSSVVNAGIMPHPLGGESVVALVARGNAYKLRAWRRDPRATIVFRAGWAWAGVEGNVDIIGPEDLRPGFDEAAIAGLLRDVFMAAGGTHDDWDEYDRVMAAERRAAVLITPTRVYGVGQAGRNAG